MAKTTVTVKMPDLDKWVKAVNQLTVETGNAIVETAVENSPFVSGGYRQGIKYDNAYTVTANTKYSAAIEYGFDNYEEKVKEYERVITKAFGKDITPITVTVKAHTRTMNRTPNPVMRSSARAVQKQIPELFKIAQQKSGL